MNTFDLHMHSKYSSDGEFSPEELIQMNKKAGLTTVALSDHNTNKGIDAMIAHGLKEGIQVIPAMEFDTLFEELEVHVLGYNFDYQQDSYFETLQSILDKRKNAASQARIEKLNEYYHMDFDAKELLKEAGTRHAFNYVVETFLRDPRYKDRPEFQPYQPGGHRAEPASVNFYWDNCCAGTPCYVRIEYPSLSEIVKRIHDAGGIAVIAHPFRNFYHKEDLLNKALAQGIDGIEAYSNYHDQEQNHYYANFCEKNNVLITCGSDFHGKTKPNIQLGEYGFDRQDGDILLEKFIKAITTYK